jgi:hypothetical protein
MPNTEVKLLRAESSWWETACEDRALPREARVRRKSGSFFVLFGAAKQMCAFYSTGGYFLIISLKIDSTIEAFLIIRNFFT